MESKQANFPKLSTGIRFFLDVLVTGDTSD